MPAGDAAAPAVTERVALLNGALPAGGSAREAAAEGQSYAAAGGAEGHSTSGPRDSSEDSEPAGSPAPTQRLAQHAELYECWQGGVHRVFVDHPLFHSSGADIYGSTAGGGKGVYTYLEAGEVTDLDLRYSVLCQAALAAPVLLERSSGSAVEARQIGQAGEQQRIVYVANDWPTALLLLRLQYSVRALGAGAEQQPALACCSGGNGDGGSGCAVADAASLQQLLAQRLGANAAAVFCIHNLAYQGVLSAEAFARLSLPAAALPALCTSSDWREVLLQLKQVCAGDRQSGAPPPPQLQQQASDGQALPLSDTFAAAPAAAAGIAAPAAAPAGDAATAAAAASLAAAREPAVAMAMASCSSGELNQMRSALLAADCLVTVSRGYAVEVQHEGPFGCGLHDILAARGISGIMNGVDTAEWDPAVDPWLPEAGRYTVATVAHGKAQMKAWLQERLGLAVDPAAPLIGFVGRLTMQKGVDVLLGAAPALLAGCAAPPGPSRWRPEVPETDAAAEGSPASQQPGAEGQAGSFPSGSDASVAQLGHGASRCTDSSLPLASPLHQPAASRGGVGSASQTNQSAMPAGQPPAATAEPAVQLVLLGTGEPWMESALLGLSQSFPCSAAGLTTFSEELAHWIMAGSDFVVVPSRFEPCGLVAQAGLRYGAVPIVCAVGGLKDLVTPEVGYTLPAFSHAGTAADHRQNVQQLVAVVRQAAAEYGTARYQAMQQHCMALDVSWEQPAAEWEQLLERVAAQLPAARAQAA